MLDKVVSVRVLLVACTVSYVLALGTPEAKRYLYSVIDAILRVPSQL